MIRSTTIRIATVLFAAALALPCALAAPGKGNKGGADRTRVRVDGAVTASVETRSGTTFSVGIDFDGARRLAVQHGYTGYESLPRGIQKRLARGKPLPPGIAKRVVPTPMLRELPEHTGHEWRVCGANLVLVAEHSGIVAEVFVDLFR